MCLVQGLRLPVLWFKMLQMFSIQIDTKMAINFAPEVSFVPIKVQDVNKTRREFLFKSSFRDKDQNVTK